MRKGMYIICMWVAWVCGCVCANAAPVAVISEEERVFDAGRITIGDTVRHIYVIRNAGEDALVIESVSTSCDCTEAEWTAGAVGSGDSAIVRVTHTPQFIGEFSQKMVVRSNAKGGRITLRMTGETVKRKKVGKK